MPRGKYQLRRKQEEAIVALLSQRTVDEAARAINTHSRTIYRWMQDAAFKAAYLDARRTAYSQSLARLQQMTGAAVSTLAKVMVDPNAPAASRVRAAHSVLDHAAKAIELEDLEARLTALENTTKDVSES